MTLTRMIPSLRRTLPDPMNHDFWPEEAVATPTDVVVSGLSLLRLVDVCGTPCVHGGAAVIPGTGGRPSASGKATVVIVRVTRLATGISGAPVIETDAQLDTLRLIWSEIRLIGRASTARSGRLFIARRPTNPHLALTTNVVAVELPLDVRVGELLVIPRLPLATSGTPDSTTGSRPDSSTAGRPNWLSALE